MRQFKTISARRGFTMPEVLLAMLLLTMGLTSVLLLFPTGARMQADAANDTSGRAYAETALASLRGCAPLLAATPAGSPTLANPALATPQNPLGITAIPSSTSTLPLVPAPSGNYQYRVCYWQPFINGALATGHYHAAVFAFVPSGGPTGTSDPVVATGGKILLANNAGTTTLSVAVVPPFSQDQYALVQNVSSVNEDVYVVHVVQMTTAGNVTVVPAIPNVANNNTIVFVYLRQRAAAIATGSLQ